MRPANGQRNQRIKCRARAKKHGGPCQGWAMPGRELCYYHGGRSLAGAASPRFKDGRHSKYLPTRLAAKYAEAQADPELLSLRSEVALVDARLADLFTRVETGESGQVWEQWSQAWEEFRQRRVRGDIPGMHRSMERLDALMARGRTDHQAWQEILGLVEQRRKLCESESKRLVGLQQTMNAEQVLTLVGAITGVITRRVVDKQALSEITVDLQQILHQGDVVQYALPQEGVG